MKIAILNETIRHKINQVIIDYEVEFDFTGKVYNSKALLFDLPLNGQKLILGENHEEMKSQIIAFQNLIPIIIPIGLHNQDSFFADELNHIYTSINSLLEQNQIQLSVIDKYAEHESFEYYVHSSCSKSEEYPENFQNIWTNAIELIESRNSDLNIDNLSFLGYYYPQFGFKIISLIIPFIKLSNTKRIAYEALENCTNEECLSYLKEELKTCKDGQALSGIFKALSKHQLKDLEIHKELVRIYKSEIVLSEDSKANIMDVLEQFPNKESIEIGVEILSDNNRYSSRRASAKLLEMGYPAKNIADIMLPNLIAADPKKSEAAFSIFCNSDQLIEFIPNSRELLKIYVKSLEVNQNLNISYSMPSMLRKKHENSISNEIMNYLTSQNSNVLVGIMILVNSLMDEQGINSAPFYSKKAKQKYTDLLNHERQNVVEYAMKILQKIGRKEANGEYIDLFLDIINYEDGTLKNLYAMRAINNLLPAVKFNERIVEYYKKALEISNYNYRVAAIRGLRFSRDQNLKRSLNYLKDDPSDKVRKEVSRLMEPPNRDPKSSLSKKILRYAYMKLKYKGKPPSQNELFKEYIRKEFREIDRNKKERINKFKLK